MPNYHIYGSALYTVTQPNHSQIQPPNKYSTDTRITEPQLMEFVNNLHDKIVPITATTDPLIRVELRNKVNLLLHTGQIPPHLSVGNPIVDLEVNHSRPSGEAEVWSGSELTAFWMHPATLQLPPPPNTSIPIAVAQHATGGWTSASVVAYKVQ